MCHAKKLYEEANRKWPMDGKSNGHVTDDVT